MFERPTRGKVKWSLNEAQLYNAVEDAADRALTDIGGRALAMAKKLAPVRNVFTGNYQAKRRVTREEASAIAKAERAAVGPGVRVADVRQRFIATRPSVASRTPGHTSLQLPKLQRTTGRPSYGGVMLGAGFSRELGFRGMYDMERMKQKELQEHIHKGRGELFFQGPRDRFGLTQAEQRLSYGGRKELERRSAVYVSPERHITLGGRLRDEIYLKDSTVRGTYIEIQIVSPTPYARFVEFGTRRSMAQPFLRPTLMRIAPSLKPAMERAVADLGRVR